MGVVSTSALIILFCFVLVDKTDGNTMTLSSGTATVGQPVTLQCAYIGSSTLYAVNFYKDADNLGLQIAASGCAILSSAGYTISLYDKACGIKEVNLTIKSVTKDDIGITWSCDATLVGGATVPKVSTIITAQNTPKAASPVLSPGAIAGIVVGVVVLAVNVALILLVIFKPDLSTTALIVIIIVAFLTAAVVVLIFLLIKKCCGKKPDSSKESGRLDNPAVQTENIPMRSGQLPPLPKKNGNKLGP